ncbi:hypothetical protein MOV61_06655 [Neorhizobium sp. BETTINA12A]|uniref:BtpA/SgcQ family protein n=1 Tax=Neorhizobium sp. BETTINA12A TaxID=2908924 RepID=UPI001FF2461E|nr:BtpA/SgcQ family protein [Neorhizobium sp. BETTINA12A]MCJ9750399.1 hypothetical protein [Neorhizobium sp. BETTINA12A]
MKTKQTNPFCVRGQKSIIGMVHLPPLPGTPFFVEGSFTAMKEAAVRDALALDHGGADGCLVQTVDRVYPTDNGCDPARVSALTMIASAVVEATRADFVVGVQIMSNAIDASIAVAKIVGADFVRATAFIGATATQWGLLQGDPQRTIAYRKSIAAEDIAIVADIRTQHFSWTGGTPTVARIARWAKEAGADAVCLGDPDEAVVAALAGEVRIACPNLPIMLSGHTDHANAARLLAHADGALVGTCLQGQEWAGAIEEERVRAYLTTARGNGHG